MRFLIFLTAVLSVSAAIAEEFAVPANCRQIVFVTSPAWSSQTASLQRWTRAENASWEKIGRPVSVQVGERGMAWGLGLHPTPTGGEPCKTEGDRRAPAGLFRLTSAFARGAAAVGKMPWQAITPSLEAVDDPASRFYNRIVDRARIERPDWRSSEKMAAIPDYALGVVVAHNPRHAPGAGSCIFLHLWLGRRAGTAGCTILREADLLTLVRWLDPAHEPLLIQLPANVAARALNGF